MPEFSTPLFTEDVSANWMGRDIERESRLLVTKAETRYPHKSGIGDHREDILTEFVERRLPQNIHACKGHVGDSECRQTSEFDLVVYDSNAHLLLASGPEGRAIVPIESVRACVEVRSILDRSALSDTNSKSVELRRLTRRFLPTQLGRHMLPTLAKDEIAKLDSGVLSCDCTFSVPPVPVMSVGYTSISAAGVKDAYESAGPYVWSVTGLGCVHGVRQDANSCTILELGHLSLVYFVMTLVKYLEFWQSSANWIRPDWERYFRHAGHPPENAV